MLSFKRPLFSAGDMIVYRTLVVRRNRRCQERIWLGSLPRAAEHYYLVCNSLVNELHQCLVFERFCKKSESSRIECGPAHWRIVSSANEDNSCLGRISAETGLHFQTVHVGHPYVQDCYATWGMFEPGEKRSWKVKLLHNKTGRIH